MKLKSKGKYKYPKDQSTTKEEQNWKKDKKEI